MHGDDCLLFCCTVQRPLCTGGKEGEQDQRGEGHENRSECELAMWTMSSWYSLRPREAKFDGTLQPKVPEVLTSIIHVLCLTRHRLLKTKAIVTVKAKFRMGSAQPFACRLKHLTGFLCPT